MRTIIHLDYKAIPDISGHTQGQAPGGTALARSVSQPSNRMELPVFLVPSVFVATWLQPADDG